MIIYKGILSHKSVTKIHKDLYDATINKKVVSRDMLTYAGKVAKKVKKYDRGVGNYYGPLGLSVLADKLIEEFISKGIDDNMRKIINHQEMEEAERKKHDIIDKTVEKARTDKKIFYLASSHNDCAEDHKDYQGKLYVDRYWHNYDKTDEVKKYIRENNIRTIQWVMGKPAWFITRPNCRHYFITLKTEDVLKYSLKKLKRKNKTHTKTGDYDLQTPRKMNLEKYEEKLRTLEELYSAHPTEKLKKMIEKVKLIINKYKKK